jgi:DNA repair exonuclease SbcCD nuclease subunit
LSDIHIGLNQRENWYQQKAHERYVQAILRYIAAKGKTVRDVVLLGDLFDTWEYASENSVPEPEVFLQECIKANAPLFRPGNDGDFVSVLNAIGGDLWYINGNHDMSIPVGAVNKALNLTGKLIQGNPDPLKNFVYPSSDPNIYAEHGHRFSLMCRPDKAGNTDNGYYPLPLGYYVSRIVGTYCKNILAQTRPPLISRTRGIHR